MSGNPIWKTAEAEAWCRGFGYADYLNVICVRMNVAPLTERVYHSMCNAFDMQMESDLAKERSEAGI